MLLAFFIICSLFRGLQSWGYYTIVAPGTFRSKSEYHVAVSLDNFFKSCSFRITLNGNYEVIANTSIEVEPMTTKLVKIQLPNLFYGYGSLQVDGYRGIISKDFSRVNIEERQYTVYIQTDKSKYKAGDRMQFRALFLDRLIRPVKLDDVIDVLIYDGQKNLIRKFTGIKLLKGVFKGHLQLSEHPVLGQWCIEVNVGGEILREEYFEVARYVLPKFSVEINAKKNVGVIEGKMDIKVKSSYAHDQPVKGNLALNFNSELTALGCSAINMTHEFNGEASITIDFIKDLNIQDVSSLYRSDICVYEVTAIVTDGLTQQSQSASTDLVLFFQPFKIKVEAPGFLDPTDSLPITVSVTDLEGNSIQDSTNPVTISVTASKVDINRVAEVVSDNQFQSSEMDWTLEKTVYLNQIGVGVTEFEVPRAEFISEFKARAKYLNYSSYSVYVKRNTVGTLKLEVMTERPEVGKELAIRVKSKEPIGYFIYEMMSRGDIVQSARVDVPGNSNEHLLCIPVTFSMVPKVTIFVHNIKNGIFNSRLKEVYVRRAFKNHINITADHTEVLPGALVSLNITTDPGSYVGLLGINEKVLININNKATTTEDNIFTELRNYDSINVADEVHPGSEAGFITFSNARNKAGEVIGSAAGSLGPGVFHPLPEPFVKPSIDLPHMRALFSDNWIFADFESTPDEGLKLIETVPETITTWAVTGFSLNPDTGLTLTKYPTKLKVFQKFFISMDLPSSIKVGEIIEIPVYVSNHLDHNLPSNVTMINLGDDFELLEKLDSENRVQPIQTFQRSIPANGTEKVIYLIKPLKVGRFRVTVMATSPEARDVVQKNLTVEPDGVPYSISKTFLINLLEYNEEHLTEAFVQIPENAVPLSENVQISVIGDVFGPLIRTIQNFVRAPFGSSETSLKYFLSNLWVLKYLKVIGHTNPCLESKAKLFLESGYQTLLSFKHLDGSFSRFDRFRERTGDTRLTAFILSAFQQAEEFIQLDQKVVQRGLDYLKSKQAENGGFRSGKDVDEDAVLTSFIMLAFLVKEKNHSMYESITSKGLTYLYDTLDDLKEPTPVAISTYVLIVGRHKKSGELLKKLGSQVIQKDQRHQWAGRDTIQSNMETTTYSFMSLLESQELPLNNLLPIVKSLISVTNGKWTHTHILALQAMIKFAHHLHFKTNRLDIHFENDNNETGDFKVNSSNAQILQQITLKKSCQSIKFRTKGKGFALISVNYNYNLVSQNRTSSKYETSVRVNEPNNWTMSLDICTAMRLPKTQSNLTIVDVKLPSGYSVSEGNFEKIKKDNDLVKGIELNQSDQSVRIYLENISQNGTCIQLTGSKTSSLFNLKPMTIDVYNGINESMTE